jgi:hypothetical protein
MVESKEETFVKEERWPEAILAAIHPPILLRQLAATSVSCFSAALMYPKYINFSKYFAHCFAPESHHI